MRTKLLALLPLLLLAACEVNQMPMYQAQISAVDIQSAMSGALEVNVDVPMAVGVDGAALPISDPTQDLIVDRFVDRLDRRVVAAEVGATTAQTFAEVAAPPLGWVVDPYAARHDARFMIDVTSLDVDVDPYGVPTVAIAITTEGWFEASGALIYREYTTQEMTLLALEETVLPLDPGNPDDVGAARAINLLTLDSMPDSELRARVYGAVELTAAAAADSLRFATLGR